MAPWEHLERRVVSALVPFYMAALPCLYMAPQEPAVGPRMPTFFHHHLHLVRASSCIDSRSRVAGISDSPDRSAAPPAAMLSWKEKVAEKLSRLLADTPSSAHPLRGDYSPVASDDSQAIFLQEFASPEKSSYPSNFSSLTNTTNFGVDEREPKSYSHSHIVSSSAQHSLPKIWKSNLFVWKDGPSTSTEESETRSDCEEIPEKSNGNTGQISDQHINGFLTSNKVSTKHDLGEYLSYLTEKSTFMSSDLFEFFQSCLPNIVKGCQWILLYSTWKHGISLHTLLRNSIDLPGPCLLIVGDMQGAVFGGLLDSPLEPTAKRKYQGTSQTFVFSTIYGGPRLFRATGANRFYYLCLNDQLAFGGGGNFALSLDEDLLHGTSGPCDTFGNLCLAHYPEFELKNVELWGFAHSSRYLN